jgi:hypothetical protein
MTASSSPIPVSVDYTSRDYYALRADLIQRVQDRVNTNLNKQWNGTDENDFGVALIEAMAYMGDIINYYVDRVANESSITTATQRESLLNLANLYGYTPSSYQAASTTMTFTNTTGSPVTIPLGTELYTSIAYNDTIQKPIFNTLSDVTVPAASGGTNGTASVTASHGEIVSIKNSNQYGELVGASTGIANQSFPLTYNQVVQGSVTVYVQRGFYYDTWTEVTDLTPYGPTDTVYYLTTDSDNIVSVNFSDGVSGAIPTNQANIYVDYTIGGGVVGNLPTNQTFSFYALPLGSSLTLPISGVTAKNTTVALGGVDPESSDSIRTNAPAAISTLNRVVSTADYINLSLGYSGVGKANIRTWAIGTSQLYQISLYVAPYRDATSAEIYPGYDSTGTTPTTELTTLATNLQTYLQNRAMVGVSVNVYYPYYTDAFLTVKFTTLPQFSYSDVKNSIKTAFLDIFAYRYMNFQDTITPEEIEAQLRNVVGVSTVQVFVLRASSGVGGTYPSGNDTRGTLQGIYNQVFIFSSNSVKAIPVASLSGLVVKDSSSNPMTLVPAFSPDIFDYTIAGSSNTTVTVTPTIPTSYYANQGTNTVGNDSITVNGGAVSSGVASGSVSTPSATTTTIPVVVTTVDSLTSQTYNIHITRS